MGTTNLGTYVDKYNLELDSRYEGMLRNCA